MKSPEEILSILENAVEARNSACRKTGLRGIAYGLPQIDDELQALGRDWLLANPGGPTHPRRSKPNSHPREVFVATRLSREGGHTQLIGDLTRARRNFAEQTLIVTNIGNAPSDASSTVVQDRVGLRADQIITLPNQPLNVQLDTLLRTLRDIGPDRLYLVHDPGDPLPVAAAQEALGHSRFLIHHSDATPALGLHVPGATIVELNPIALSFSRMQGLEAELLPLTCPDPGPRPFDFEPSKRLVTASSGSISKFRRPYHYSYAETVATVLEATGGRHVHIGPLDEPMLNEISDALHAKTISIDRFIHHEWVSSVAQALWDDQCDLYLASFPVDGARTLIEVAASGTPYLAHSVRRVSSSLDLDMAGIEKWRTLDDLKRQLSILSNVGTLQEKSRLIRQCYLQRHHPDVFQKTLNSILEGRGGIHDPDAETRDLRTLARMVPVLAAGLIEQDSRSAQSQAGSEQRLTRRFDDQEKGIAALTSTQRQSRIRIGRIQKKHQATRQRLKALKRKQLTLRRKVSKLKTRLKAVKRRKGLLARLGFRKNRR